MAPNTLIRRLTVSAPDVAWVSDITYVRVDRKEYYLTVFIDFFSRIVVDCDTHGIFIKSLSDLFHNSHNPKTTCENLLCGDDAQEKDQILKNGLVVEVRCSLTVFKPSNHSSITEGVACFPLFSREVIKTIMSLKGL